MKWLLLLCGLVFIGASVQAQAPVMQYHIVSIADIPLAGNSDFRKIAVANGQELAINFAITTTLRIMMQHMNPSVFNPYLSIVNRDKGALQSGFFNQVSFAADGA